MDIVKELKSKFPPYIFTFSCRKGFFPRRANFMGVFGILIDNCVSGKIGSGAL